MKYAFLLLPYCQSPLSCYYGNRVAIVVEETLLRLRSDGGSRCQWQHGREAVYSNGELNLAVFLSNRQEIWKRKGKGRNHGASHKLSNCSL